MKSIKINPIQKYADQLLALNCVHSGSSLSDDGETGCDWWVFDGKLSPQEVFDRLYVLGIDEDGYKGEWGDSDCSGRVLSDPVRIRRTLTRILVKQSWCYDF
jgi:hypothetical protein